MEGEREGEGCEAQRYGGLAVRKLIESLCEPTQQADADAALLMDAAGPQRSPPPPRACESPHTQTRCRWDASAEQRSGMMSLACTNLPFVLSNVSRRFFLLVC